MDGQEQVRAILVDVFNHEEFERLAHRLEEIMASIADLSTDVAALTAAVGNLPAPGVTSINAADQATLDAADAAVQAATASVAALAPAPPAA